jgi:RNA polymerase sigma factor (sigma-70 family)
MKTGHAVVPPPEELRGDPNLSGLTDERLLGQFIDQRDSAAFEALVVRHAPRVLGVCRQVLRAPQDVEDAFQSTFLLLARNAASIRKRESLGHWLHGVAHRLAVRLKIKSSRRGVAERESRGVGMAGPKPEDEANRSELRHIIHQEIDRLPERLRQPVMLCYLEGLTNEAAARNLGCPTGTLKVRLATAREILHGRLARRGLALSISLLLFLRTRSVSAAEVPRRLVDTTVNAVMASAGKHFPLFKTRAPGHAPTRLGLFVLGTAATGALGTTFLYLASPERVGFITWFLGAVRKACH